MKCDECGKDASSTSGAQSDKYEGKMLCRECEKEDEIESKVELGIRNVHNQIDLYHNPVLKTEYNFPIADESSFDHIMEVLRRLWKRLEYNRVDLRIITDLKTVEK